MMKNLDLDSANVTTLPGIPRLDLEVLIKGGTGNSFGSVKFGIRRFA